MLYCLIGIRLLIDTQKSPLNLASGIIPIEIGRRIILLNTYILVTIAAASTPISDTAGDSDDDDDCNTGNSNCQSDS